MALVANDRQPHLHRAVGRLTDFIRGTVVEQAELTLRWVEHVRLHGGVSGTGHGDGLVGRDGLEDGVVDAQLGRRQVVGTVALLTGFGDQPFDPRDERLRLLGSGTSFTGDGFDGDLACRLPLLVALGRPEPSQWCE